MKYASIIVVVVALRQANFDTATAADGVDITSGCCCLSNRAPKLPQLVLKLRWACSTWVLVVAAFRFAKPLSPNILLLLRRRRLVQLNQNNKELYWQNYWAKVVAAAAAVDAACYHCILMRATDNGKRDGDSDRGSEKEKESESEWENAWQLAESPYGVKWHLKMLLFPFCLFMICQRPDKLESSTISSLGIRNGQMENIFIL